MKKEFNINNTYVFSTKKFRKDYTNAEYRESKSWVDKCNGVEVCIKSEDEGEINGYSINIDWCKCIKTGGINND